MKPKKVHMVKIGVTTRSKGIDAICGKPAKVVTTDWTEMTCARCLVSACSLDRYWDWVDEQKLETLEDMDKRCGV